MSRLTSTIKVDGVEVERESIEAWRATVDGLRSGLAKIREASTLWPEAERDRLEKALRPLERRSTELGKITLEAEQYSKHMPAKQALDQALADADWRNS